MGGNHQHQSSSMVISVPHFSPNPIVQLQSRFKEMEVGFKSWLAKQPIAVEAAVVTATSAFRGAAIGGLMRTLSPDAVGIPTPPASLSPQYMVSLKQAQTFAGGPLIQARNFAVMMGVNVGISRVVKKICGVEDVPSSMVLAFGSGAMFSLVSGMGGPNPALNAVTSGLFFALFQGGLFESTASGPLIQARDFAVMTGVDAGISCVMKRLRGVEDVQSSMAAAFGSGAMYFLVTGRGGSNPAVNAVAGGVCFALIQGGLFKLSQKLSQPDVVYMRTKSMLAGLGLQNYVKNFKKGLLTDRTLPLLTDRALRDVKIPPGARLLILDHISRDTELKDGGSG